MSQDLQQHITNKTNKNKIRYLDISNNDLVEFPNLKKINGGNNPLRAKNLQNLTSEQFNKLVEKMKDKSIQINSYKSTILMDLLEYTQGLIKNGDSSQRQQAQQLQAILQNSSGEQVSNNSKTLLLVGVSVLVVLALVIGYL
ncbi:5158_t:CDS:2 [Funneliformis geosporum]|nr:5158_t:CDS:2 [Funneliformis geosporum]